VKAKTFGGAAILIAAGAFEACSSSSSSANAVVDAGPTTAANGTVGAWTTAAAMPFPRANFCAVATNGFLVVIGGNYSKDPTAQDPTFTNLDEIDTAKINADGSLGQWIVAGQTPSPVNSCTAAALRDGIFLLDGIYDDQTVGGKLYAAKIDSSGKISTFSALGSVPSTADLYASTAWFDGPDGGETLSVFNSYLGDDTSGDAGALTVLHAAPQAPITWNETPFLPRFRGHPELAVASSFAYALGGYAGGDDDAGANFAQQAFGVSTVTAGNGANEVSAFSATALPKATMFGDAVAVDGYLFVVGGRDSTFGNDPRADVMSAPIASDGTLGTWSAQTALPAPRTNERVVAYGDYVYVMGGGNTGPGLDSVYIAQIRF
jgi:Kelch motif